MPPRGALIPAVIVGASWNGSLSERRGTLKGVPRPSPAPTPTRRVRQAQRAGSNVAGGSEDQSRMATIRREARANAHEPGGALLGSFGLAVSIVLMFAE